MIMLAVTWRYTALSMTQLALTSHQIAKSPKVNFCTESPITPKFNFQWMIYGIGTMGALMPASVTFRFWWKTLVPGTMIIDDLGKQLLNQNFGKDEEP